MSRLKSALFYLFKGTFRRTGIGNLPVMWMIYDYLFPLLWPEKNILEIQGSKMYLNFSDKSPSIRHAFQAYALSRIHEANTTRIFQRVVKEGNTVVDLGANIGYFTLLAARLAGKDGHVYAFEPEPRNYSYLVKT